MNNISIIIIIFFTILFIVAFIKLLDYSFYKQLYLIYFLQTPSSPIEIIGKYNVSPNDKKIISLSLFGKKQYYFNNIRKMCIDVKKYFPKWKIRIYIHHLVNPNIIQEFIQKNCQVFIVKQDNVTPSDSTFWRFLAAQDNVIFISRDVDYQLNHQDYQLTEKWIKEDKTKFIKYMPLCNKDKYVLGYTNSKYLMRNFWAGFWGGRDKCVPDMLDKINEFKYRKHWHSDELFLETIIWNKYIGDKGVKLIMDNYYKNLGKKIYKQKQNFIQLEFIDLKLKNKLKKMTGKEAVNKFIEFYDNQRTL
jgi:hypothetical protein